MTAPPHSGVSSNRPTKLKFPYYLKEMARKRLKMTKKAIAARRRYRQKKKTGAGCACKKKGGRMLVPPKWAGIKKGAGVRKKRRRRRVKKGEGFFDDVGSFLTNAAQTVLPLLPMIL